MVECTMFYVLIFSLAAVLLIVAGVTTMSRRRRSMRAEVLWIDHFGNVQLAATTVDTQMAELPGRVDVTVELDVPNPPPGLVVRRVETFDELAPGELGLMTDANGHLAVVAGQASAARALTVIAGQMVLLTW